MGNLVSIYELGEISEVLAKASPAMALVNVYMGAVDERNGVRVKKTELADALGKTRRTISEWIIKLCKYGVIKYKYSGETRLNPFFYYNGTLKDYERAKQEWQEFKSDIPALKN